MSVVTELFHTFLSESISVVSLRFLAFLVFVVILYYIVPRKLQWIVLAAANTLFYIWGGIEAFFYLAGTVVVGYGGARWIAHVGEAQTKAVAGLQRDEMKSVRAQFQKKKKRLLILFSICVLAVLAVTKYTGFLLQNLNRLSVFSFETEHITASLPVILGCSYYTLSLLSYLTDVYREKVKAEKNPLKLYLFISFFPHIIQGPIARYDQLAAQLTAPHPLNFSKLKTGAILIAWGFFKKLVIAVRLAAATQNIFSDYTGRSGSVIALGVVLFSFQIYADWTAYCDIVQGAAEMLGIKLAKNFDRPYFSQSIPEFWRRWHMTMGAFFKDYVLYPVSASKLSLWMNKKARKMFGNNKGRVISSVVPILSVWFLTGLWHGASWNFICWGLYQGVLIVLSLAFTPLLQKWNQKLHFKTDRFSWKLFRIVRTFLLCCVGRVFFCAGSAAHALEMFARLLHPLVSWNDLWLSYGLDIKDWVVLVLALLLLLCVSLLQNTFEVRQRLDMQPILVKWPILIALIVAIVVFGVYGSNTAYISFVYEQF